MSKRHTREDVNQMHLTSYWLAVQKVEVMPDKAPFSVCDSTVTAGYEYPMAVNIPSVMTKSTAEDSNKKRKIHRRTKCNQPKEPISRIAQSVV